MENKSMAAADKKVSNYIPDEITYSILSKLPLKSLKRFECVHKSWSLLFQNHHFMNMFVNKFLSKNMFLNKFLPYNDPPSFILRAFFNYDDEVFYSFSGEKFENKVKLDWSNSYRDRFHTTSILGFGSVFGTLCLYGGNDDIVLWNPATQTIKPLPDSEAQLIEFFIPDESLGSVHWCVDYHPHGFGYDPAIDDYKVIRFINVYLQTLPDSDDDSEGSEGEIITLDRSSYKDFHPFWEMYSLRSNSWRELYVDMPYSLIYGEGTRVYMNGVCHWLCEENNSNSGPCLVSFYLTKEEFIVTSIPSDLDDCFIEKLKWIKLAVLNQSIALISYHKKTFHISILGAFGLEETWTKLLTVGPLSCVDRPIGVGMKGEIVFLRKDRELVWLDLSTQMISELGYKGGGIPNKIIMYKESILAIE